MPNDKPLNEFYLQLKSELEALTQLLAWFEQTIIPLIPEQCGWQSQLALVEGFTNAVRHAHHNLPCTTPIDLEVKLFQQSLEMRVFDQGQPFNLKEALEVQSSRNEQLRLQDSIFPEEGWGLIWIQQLTDELDYIRLPNERNCLVMRKKLIVQGADVCNGIEH